MTDPIQAAPPESAEARLHVWASLSADICAECYFDGTEAQGQHGTADGKSEPCIRTDAQEVLAALASLRAQVETLTRERDTATSKLVAEASARAAWQPIETAPKDGTPVMVYCTRGDYRTIAEWKEHIRSWVDGGYVACEPTHWQPLPPAPSGPQESR